MTKTLGEAFPQEQARCRELLLQYESVGPAGVFAKTFIKQTLQEADEAAISGDVVAMLRAFKKMEGHQ